MPQYVLFLIPPNRAEAQKAVEEAGIDEIKEDPAVQKIVQDFLKWSEGELRANRIKDIDFLLPASEATSIRIDFHQSPTTAAAPDAAAKPEKEGDDDNNDAEAEPVIPKVTSTVTRGQPEYVTKDVLCYYKAEFPTAEEAIAWARSCPLSYDGFALEIKELQDAVAAIAEAPAESKEWAGDQIVFQRQKMLEQGKMKKDEDGTLWVKVEDDEEVKEIVIEAEKRVEQNEQ